MNIEKDSRSLHILGAAGHVDDESYWTVIPHVHHTPVFVFRPSPPVDPPPPPPPAILAQLLAAPVAAPAPAPAVEPPLPMDAEEEEVDVVGGIPPASGFVFKVEPQ